MLKNFSPESVVMTAVTTTHVTRQATTETHHPSSTASLSTHSTFATHSPSKVTQDMNETLPTNSVSPETSIHLTATTSQSHTLPHGEITTTDQTKTALVVGDSSGTTALRTTKLASVTTILSSTEEPASSNNGEDTLARNPGLVAILCIFFIILALVIVVAIAKIISCRKSSQFERLEDLPMNKMNEDAPFARYPPK
ncbi:hypothetical protein PDJAM_G00028510 [Pangasius djambal]|uniref:Uncharacterized protein n=1 Tax=Pangasius djambal TaxID=1691987 RepID=A0ACC5YQ62_9TELE|nr:hypothetical protein [Pangasius djambal]